MSKVTLSRDDLVAEATEYLVPYRGARNIEDYPAIMADFAMMIAARVAVRMMPPPGHVVVPREPTLAMRRVAIEKKRQNRAFPETWRAVIDAAVTKESEG